MPASPTTVRRFASPSLRTLREGRQGVLELVLTPDHRTADPDGGAAAA